MSARRRRLGDIPRPLSTRECADWMGVDSEYIRGAIKDGELRAEKVERPGKRPLYRVHQDDFRAFLVRIKWSRLPAARSQTETE